MPRSFIRFKCYPDGGEVFEVDAGSRAITAWEVAPGQPKGTQRDLGEALKGLRMRDLVDLAWFAALAAEVTGLDLRDWRKQVDIELVNTDDDADAEGTAGPTGQAHTATTW